jgi:hypothetical protein
LDWITTALRPEYALAPDAIPACVDRSFAPAAGTRVQARPSRARALCVGFSGARRSGVKPIRLAGIVAALAARRIVPTIERIVEAASEAELRSQPRLHSALVAARTDAGLEEADKRAGLFPLRYRWLRYVELHQVLARFDVQTVVEFGAGASSAIMGEFLRGRGSVLSLEESPRWHAAASGYLAPWSGVVDLQLVPRVIESDQDGSPICRYDFDADLTPDLVYVDGPTNSPETVASWRTRAAAWQYDPKGGYLPCVDVVRMWERDRKPRVILIDGRRSSVRYLIEHAPLTYRVWLASTLRRNCGLSELPVLQHHTILVDDRAT